MTNPFVSLADSARDYAANMQMVLERQPDLRPQIEALTAQARAEIEAMFQPYIDLAEGRIDVDEFERIQRERTTAEQERRRLHYGLPEEPDDPEDLVVDVVCRTCSATRQWDVVEQDSYPPIYFECEDLDGEPCEGDEDEAELARHDREDG